MGADFVPADFHPQLVGYTGQGAFRFWCQKVLPIVYDDSLSYYELLNKVVVYLNNVISDFGAMVDNFDEVVKTFYKLQDYVNEYLDLDAAVERALDKMAEDGTLERVFGDIIRGEIDQWLDLHPEATTTVVDGSLTLRKFHQSLKLETVNRYVTPEMFGAVGDGLTDDYEAIEQAIDAANSFAYGTSYVYFGRHYFVSQPCALKSNVNLFGNGTIESATVESPPHTIAGAFYGSDIENVEIDGLSFKQDYVTGSRCCNFVLDGTNLPGCVTLINSTFITIRNCKFLDIASTYCVEVNHCNNIGIKGCFVNRYARDGFTFINGNRYIEVLDNNIYYCGAHAYEDAEDTTMGDSYPIAISGHDHWEQAYDYMTYYAVVSRNFILDEAPHWEGIDSHGCADTIIDSNIIINRLVGIALVSNAKREISPNTGIYTNPTANDRVIVSNNYMRIYNSSYVPISRRNNCGIIAQGTPDRGNTYIDIINNMVFGYGINLTPGIDYGNVTHGYGGISVGYGRYYKISNNIVSTSVYMAISVFDVDHIKINSNQLYIIRSLPDSVQVDPSDPNLLCYGIRLRNIVVGAINDNDVFGNNDNVRKISADGLTNTSAIAWLGSACSNVKAYNNLFSDARGIGYYGLVYMLVDFLDNASAPAQNATTLFGNTTAKVNDIIRLKLLPEDSVLSVPIDTHTLTITSKVTGYICVTPGDPPNGTAAVWEKLTNVKFAYS